MMKNKASRLLLKCPISRLVVSLTNFLVSSHEWNYKYENHSFLTAQKLWPSFSWRKTRITLKESFFIKNNCILSFVSRGEKKTYFFTFVFKERERKKRILSLSSFHGERILIKREFSQREKQNFFFF